MSKFAAHTLVKTMGTVCLGYTLQCIFTGRLPIEDVLLIGTTGIFLVSLGIEMGRHKINRSENTANQQNVLEGIHKKLPQLT